MKIYPVKCGAYLTGHDPRFPCTFLKKNDAPARRLAGVLFDFITFVSAKIRQKSIF